MLGKLMKYEAKATLRTFLPLYGSVIVFAILNKGVLSLDALKQLMGGLPQGILMAIYVALCAAILALSIIVGIQRFHRNLLGAEGYLMHTLPAQTWQLTFSKLLFSTVWSVISLLLVIVCSLFMGLDWDIFLRIPSTVAAALRITDGLWGINLALVFIEVLGVVLLYVGYFFCMAYVSLSIGQLFTRHRVFLAFVAFGLISIVIQLILVFGIDLWQNRFSETIRFMEFSPMQQLHFICGVLAAIAAVFGCISYFTSNFLLKRHLNLL